MCETVASHRLPRAGSLLVAIGLVLQVLMACACSQGKKESYVIGIVNPNPRDRETVQGFIRSLARYGYDEKNVMYIICENRKTMETDLGDMVRRKADLVFTVTTPAANAASKVLAGTNIPVVFVMFDAIDSGVVKSLIQPGGDFTGVQIRGSTAKSLEWLRLMAPGVAHIFLPVSYDTKAAEQSVEDVKLYASRHGITQIGRAHV